MVLKGYPMAPKKKARVRVITGAKKAKLHVESPVLRLDLGCGQSPQEGHTGVDRYAKGAVNFDLWSGEKWPWEDESVDELFSSHTIEHIEPGNRWTTYTGQGNLFYFFFEECWRILKPGGSFKLIWPSLKSVRAFQDPTHCRFIPMETLYYLDRNVREMNKLDHYSTQACDFVMEHCQPVGMSVEDSKKHKDVQMGQYRKEWEWSQDHHALLRKRKA